MATRKLVNVVTHPTIDTALPEFLVVIWPVAAVVTPVTLFVVTFAPVVADSAVVGPVTFCASISVTNRDTKIARAQI